VATIAGMTTSHERHRQSALSWEEQALGRALHALAAGAVYFAAMGGVGWLIGPIREFYVRSGLDPVLAVLVEAPLMILVMVFASSWTIRLLRVREGAGDRLVMGAFAVLLILCSEFVGGALIRGWGFYETLANFTTRPGLIFVGLLAIAIVVPLLQPANRRARA
jgi:hypothetical protein